MSVFSCVSLLVSVWPKQQILRLEVKAGDNVNDQEIRDAVLKEVSHVHLTAPMIYSSVLCPVWTGFLVLCISEIKINLYILFTSLQCFSTQLNPRQLKLYNLVLLQWFCLTFVCLQVHQKLREQMMAANVKLVWREQPNGRVFQKN